MSVEMDMIKQQMIAYGAKITHETFNVDMLRAGAQQSAQFPPVEGVSFEEKIYDGVSVDVATPDVLTTDNKIIYLHGGCMVSGDPRYVRSYTSYLAKEYGGRVYGVIYRLAPENKFPAQVEDCAAAFKTIAAEDPEAKISVIGESGGAYLLLSLTAYLKREASRLPDALVPNCPQIDWSDALDRSNYPDDIIVDFNIVPDMRANLVPEGQDLKDPVLSPLYADFAGFPPIRVVWDESECLTPDCNKVIEKANAAGVYVESKVWTGAYHAFQTLTTMIPEAREEAADTLAFIRKVTE